MAGSKAIELAKNKWNETYIHEINDTDFRDEPSAQQYDRLYKGLFPQKTQFL